LITGTYRPEERNKTRGNNPKFVRFPFSPYINIVGEALFEDPL